MDGDHFGIECQGAFEPKWKKNLKFIKFWWIVFIVISKADVKTSNL